MRQAKLSYREKMKQAFAEVPYQLIEKGGVSAKLYGMADVPTPPPPKHGDHWGAWVYDAREHALVYPREGYYIDLWECTTCAKLLDTVFHVSAKRWMTLAESGHLVQALHDLLAPMAHLCSFGQDLGPFDVKHWLETHEARKLERTRRSRG